MVRRARRLGSSCYPWLAALLLLLLGGCAQLQQQLQQLQQLTQVEAPAPETNATARQTIQPSELEFNLSSVPSVEPAPELAAAPDANASAADSSADLTGLPADPEPLEVIAAPNTVSADPDAEPAATPGELELAEAVGVYDPPSLDALEPAPAPEPADASAPITIAVQEKEYVFFIDEFKLKNGKPVFTTPALQPSALLLPDLEARREQLYGDYDSPLPVNERLSIWGQFAGQARLSDSYLGYKKVKYYIDWWLSDEDDLSDLLQSAELYMFYVLEQIQLRGLPMELALLPFIESRFDPYAYSHASAAGLWQITSNTGKELGLESSWWQQERRDIRRSTQAALDYLESLNAEYNGDWLLALAAYNAGAGKVNRAIRRAGGKRDYWQLQLPRETREYVPKLLALAHVVSYFQLHQFQPPFIASVPRFAAVKTGGPLDLAQAAGLLGIDSAALYQLNPQLNQLATDFAKADDEILVPFELRARFEVLLKRQPPEQRRIWLSYKRKQGETLSRVAGLFGSSLQQLAQVNDLRRRADYLLIPLNGANYQRYAQFNTTPSLDELNTKDIVHTVRSGDSLWEIAREYDVRISQLELWNNLSRDQYLRLNARLIIRKQSQSSAQAYSLRDYYRREVIRPVHYKVRRGDSLALIAARYDVGVEQIRDWNSSVSGFIRPGQYLRLYLDVTKLL